VIPAAPNSWRWKAPRPSGKRCPSRGDVGTRASVGPRGRRDNPALRTKDRRPIKKGCSGSSREEGNLRPRRPAAAGGGRGGPSLGVTRPVQSSAIVQRPSSQAMVGSRRRPQAASRLVGGSRDRVLRRACSAVGAVSGGLSRLAAFVILLREGKVAARCSLTRAGAARTEATSGTLRHAGLRFGRESDALGCVRASEFVAEVVGRQPDPEKRVSTFRVKPRNGLMRGDGGLARSNHLACQSEQGAA